MAVETDELAEATAHEERSEASADAPSPLGATLGLAAVLGLAAAAAAVVLARRAGRDRGEGAERGRDTRSDGREPAEEDERTQEIPDAGNVPAAERDDADDARKDTEPASQGGEDEDDAAGTAPGDEPAQDDAPSAGRERPAAGSDPGPEDRETSAAGDGAPPRSASAGLVQRAKEQIEELTGRQAESVSGLQRADDGWRVTLELVELARVPSSTDVLATYELQLDDDGHVVGYTRGRRYHRSQADAEATE